MAGIADGGQSQQADVGGRGIESQGHRLIVYDRSLASDGGQRHRTVDGAMLIATHCAGSVLESRGESVFDPHYWAAQGRLTATAQGRGSSWFIKTDTDDWVLRHFRRGGLVARAFTDRYFWSGENAVRAFAEWRLCAHLHALGLPVPAPIAARYSRHGLLYRCDLITRRIAGAASLSARLAHAPLPDEHWRNAGRAIARLHAAGLDHADLNAHNLLLDAQGVVSVIDLDRGRLRAKGAWCRGNLARLQRSFEKIAVRLPAGRFDENCWRQLLDGYAEG